MSNYVQTMLLIVFFCTFLVHPSFGETLMGVVKDGQTGTGIGDMTVKVLNTGFQTTTNPDGSYEIDGIPEGVYSILYGGPNYSTKILPSVSIGPHEVPVTQGWGLIILIMLILTSGLYLIYRKYRWGFQW